MTQVIVGKKLKTLLPPRAQRRYTEKWPKANYCLFCIFLL